MNPEVPDNRPLSLRLSACVPPGRRGARGASPYVGEAPRCEGARECGTSCVERRPWEAEQGYGAQMDVRATSVPPAGWVLSAKKCRHTRWMRKWDSLQSLRKHASFCLSCKQKRWFPVESCICISQSSEDSRCV